jgi:hypothetical protein
LLLQMKNLVWCLQGKEPSTLFRNSLKFCQQGMGFCIQCKLDCFLLVMVYHQ